MKWRFVWRLGLTILRDQRIPAGVVVPWFTDYCRILGLVEAGAAKEQP